MDLMTLLIKPSLILFYQLTSQQYLKQQLFFVSFPARSHHFYFGLYRSTYINVFEGLLDAPAKKNYE